MDGGRIVDSCATNVRGRLWSRVHSCRNGFLRQDPTVGWTQSKRTRYMRLLQSKRSSNAISLGRINVLRGEEKASFPSSRSATTLCS